VRPAVPKQALVHTITPLERENVGRLLPDNRTILIPNAIHVHESGEPAGSPEKLILFLGRLHPIKGVDLLLEAFHQASLGPDWRLVIAGPEEVPAYVRKLRLDAARRGLTGRVEFVGPVFGARKSELLRAAWVIAVPSYSEVIGMVNLEAAAAGTPSVTTYRTGLWDWQLGGGILIQPEAAALTEGLLQASQWSAPERIERGRRSRQLVVNRYSWPVVLPQWEDFYRTLAA
jgi:glycosyltransferase involved in cell wall biosynthesis